MQLTSVKRMMGGLGGEMPSTHRQTLNDVETDPHLIGWSVLNALFLMGRVLVSRTDKADSSASKLKGPKSALTKILKGVVS